MEKLDLKKTLKPFFGAKATFEIVQLPVAQYLMVEGSGNPNTSPLYQAAMELIYGVAYTIKFALKFAGREEFVVPPPEAIWWADDNNDFLTGNKDAWHWRLMLMMPDFVTDTDFDSAKVLLAQKKGVDTAKIRLEPFDEGLVVQILYTGPYDQEGPTIRQMHEEFMPANGLVFNGYHHEIYLSDPRRVAPEKLKTIIRQPVKGG